MNHPSFIFVAILDRSEWREVDLNKTQQNFINNMFTRGSVAIGGGVLIIFVILFAVGYMIGGVRQEHSRADLHNSIPTNYTPVPIEYDPLEDYRKLTAIFSAMKEINSECNQVNCSAVEAAIEANNKKLEKLHEQHNNCSIEINRLYIKTTLQSQELQILEKECREKNKCPPCEEIECEEPFCPEKPCICEECAEPLPPCPQCHQPEPCPQCDTDQPFQPCEVHPPCPNCEAKDCPTTPCPPQEDCPPQPEPEPCLCEQCESPHTCPVPEDPICPPEECPEPTPCDPKPDCPNDCEAEEARIQQLTTSLSNLQAIYAKVTQDRDECLRTGSEGSCQSKVGAIYEQLAAELPTIITEVEQSLPLNDENIDFTALRAQLSKLKGQLQQKPFPSTDVAGAYHDLASELLSQLVTLQNNIPSLTSKYKQIDDLYVKIMNQLDNCERALNVLRTM